MCISCIGNSSIESDKIECPREHIYRWRGHRCTVNGTVSICANYGKSKGYVADFDSITGSLKTLCYTRDEVLQYREEDSVKRIRRVLHNIRTLNAHSLMEMRGIVPEFFFKKHLKDVLVKAGNHISRNSTKTAHGILEIAKDLYSIKTEFAVYDKLIKGNVSLDKKLFNIRDVLMTVVYPFFGEFTKKNVLVDVQTYRDSIFLDFETTQIAFYHIIENMAKYVKPDSRVNITFPIENTMQKVVFSMVSIHINEDEADKIFLEGYSGKQAINAQQQGEGIGLYRARALVEINGGTLDVIAGQETSQIGDVEFAENVFVMSIPKNKT